MTFADLFPDLRPWVESLAVTLPGSYIKPQFAAWQVWHILSLAMLGGATILVNLRLIGAGLTEESPSEVRRNLLPWLHVGVVGIIISGVLIGTANAERLYDSQAFLVKMVALLAGIILTYGVSMPVAAADGRVGTGPKIALGLGMAVWLFALWQFSTGDLINPGMWHMIFAAGLVVAVALRGALRWAYLALMTAMVAIHFALTHFVIAPDDYDRLNPVNIGAAWVFGGVIAAAALAQLFLGNRDREPRSPIAVAAAYATMLVWVSAGAAGRWIAFA